MTLPAELYNFIFDECIHDKALMSAWGLVSREHLVSSRFHLFSSVRLDYANAHGFAEILRTPSCEIAKFIETIVLSNQSPEPPWFPHVLPRLPAFPNVTTLCLHNSKSVLTEDMCDILRVNLPAVALLEIVNFPFAYRTAAIEFACGFAFLEALTFFPKIKHNLAPATPARIPRTLRTIALRCSLEEQPNWFLADAAPPLTALRIREAGARDFPVICRALKRLGASPESFSIEFSDAVVEMAFMRNYFLDTNTALRRLELTLGGSAVVELCSAFLARAVSPALEELVLDIWVEPARLAAHPWTALDDAIMHGPAATAIRRVELRVGTLMTWAPLAQAIRARMPACDASGVLRVRIDDGEVA
ncbi:hypothetical protein DFH09DRAFT_1413383 [Mycena vulgaris]|nr:hypothetical protein DFH09DRAFT_1413383 [Mycena vulgaris]